jgi:hypothetical protein
VRCASSVNNSLKNVGEAASARQKQARKQSLRAVNEHSEPVFNAAMATQVVFQQLVKREVGALVLSKPDAAPATVIDGKR